MARHVRAQARILLAAAWWIVDLLTVQVTVRVRLRGIMLAQIPSHRIIIRHRRHRITTIRHRRHRIITIRFRRHRRVTFTTIRTLTTRFGITLAGIRTDRFTRGGSTLQTTPVTRLVTTSSRGVRFTTTTRRTSKERPSWWNSRWCASRW